MVRKHLHDFWDRTFEATKRLASLFISLGVIGGVLSFIFVNFLIDDLQEFSRDFTGNTQVLEAITTLSRDVADNQTAIEDLGVRIEALEPKPVVVEYDLLRSYIRSPCSAGVSCEWVIRSRRTEYGNTCSAPTVIGRYFTDYEGTKFVVERSQPFIPARKDDEWSISEGDFMPLELMHIGIGEFYMMLRFDDCGENDETIYEPTMPLRGEITDELPTE